MYLAMARTTKAVILARGLGTRMRRDDAGALLSDAQARTADTGMKAMIPIGRPFLDHVMSALADAGISDICLVIGPEHDAIRTYYSMLTITRVRIHFAVQAEPKGTADAVLAAATFAGSDTVLVLNGDNYYPVEAYRALALPGASGAIGFDADGLTRGNIPRARVQQFALLSRDASGRLLSIVEKPDDATFAALLPLALVSMNLWSFTPVIFEACSRVVPSVRGELELQDAVRIAMHDLDERFDVLYANDAVLDLSMRTDIESVTAALRDHPVLL
jgi:dTDP-glucose pyrophosphorylase